MDMVAFHQVAGGVMGVEIGQQGGLIASSVVAQGIGPENALQLVAVVAASRLGPGLVVVVVVVVIALEIVMWMIGMMVVAMGTEIAWTAEIGMVVVIAMPAIGIHLVVIAFQVIAMAHLIGTQLVDIVARTGVMTGKQPQGLVVTGMEVVALHVMREGATGTGQALMTAPAEELVHLPTKIATRGDSYHRG